MIYSLEKISLDDIVLKVLQIMDEAIIGVELGLACASEKLLNLSGFMMYVATKEGNFETFIP